MLDVINVIVVRFCCSSWLAFLVMADLINLMLHFFTPLNYLRWRRSFCSYTFFWKILLFLWVFYPRLRSRSKSSLIRPSQTSGSSDQTVPDWSDLWSDECALEDRCALEVHSNPALIRLKCARNNLWSDWSAPEIAYDQTKVRSKSPLIRQKCARNHLWSDKTALEFASV